MTMAQMAAAISAQQIFNLNKSKEYTLIATQIAEKSLTDKRLITGAAKLWQFLFGRSKYDKNLSIKISYSKIAYAFQKTPRTISRWVKSLEKSGYLIVQHNHDTKGNQIKNTFFVRVPQDVYFEAQQVRDRTKNKESELKIASDKKPKKTLPEDPPCIRDEVFHTETEEFKKSPEEVFCTGELPSEGSDIFVGGRVDENVLHKDNIFKQIIIKNNNIENTKSTENTVVVFDENKNNKNTLSEEEGDIYAINREIASLKKLISDLDRYMVSLYDDDSIPDKSEKIYDIVCETRDIDGYIFMLENKKERLLRKAEKKQSIKSLSEDMNFMNQVKLKDGRAISPFTFKRLADTLVKMGYSGQALNELINEVLFSVRFGSLRVGQEGEVLNQEKAVNVALKLIRQKRWTTPTELKAFIEKDLG